MKLINTPTAVNHRFVDGNREVGQKATQFSAEWCNQIQQELWNLIVAIKGSNPDGSSEEEAAAAFNAYFKSGDVKMSPDEIDVAGAKFRRGSNGATLGTLYSLISGIIEATVKIAVGGSEWVPGNNHSHQRRSYIRFCDRIWPGCRRSFARAYPYNRILAEQSGSHRLWPMHWSSVNLWGLQRYVHIEDNEREY